MKGQLFCWWEETSDALEVKDVAGRGEGGTAFSDLAVTCRTPGPARHLRMP